MIREVVVMLDRNDITNGTSEGELWIDQVTAFVPAPEPVVLPVALGNFEATHDVWNYNAGDQPGIVGRYERFATNDAYDGDYVGRLSGNFANTVPTQNAYVSMSKTLGGIDLAQVSFWVKTSDLRAVKVRTTDHTGQTFHQSIPLKASSDWQQVIVQQVTSGTYWGGANNGQWQSPMRSLTIMLDRNDITNGTSQASMLVDRFTAQESAWDTELRIEQEKLGHVYVSGESISFPVRTDGDALTWRVKDFWGATVSTGTAAVSDESVVIALPPLHNGYYEMDVTASMAGAWLADKTASFAVVGPSLDLDQVAHSPFGIGTHFGQWWSPEMMPILEKLGAKTLRDEMYWYAVEPTKGTYDIQPKHEAYMQEAASFGHDSLFIMSFNNPLYDDNFTPYSEEGLAAFADYGVEVVERFQGQIKAVQVYNEYNISFSSGPCAQQAACYFEMLKEVYPKLKAADEDIIVIGPSSAGLDWEWLEELFQMEDEDGSALDYLDAVSVHPYRFPRHPQGMEDEMARLQSLIKQYNDGQPKPIWVTEWGWPTHIDSNGVSEETQTAYLLQSTVQLLAANVQKMFWYNSMNKGMDPSYVEDNYGIFRHPDDPKGKYAPKPAYAAYAALTRQLTGASYVAAEQAPAGIKSHLFAKDNAELRAMWSDTPQTVSLTASAGLTVTDAMGHQQTLAPTAGAVSLTLTPYPVFVEGTVAQVADDPIFAMTTSDTIIGAPMPVAVSIDNTSGTEPLTAEFRLYGVSHTLTAGAGQLAELAVTVPGGSAEQELTVQAEVWVDGQRTGRLSSASRIVQPIGLDVKHVWNDGQELLRLDLTNRSAQTMNLERIDWSVGDEAMIDQPTVGLTAGGTAQIDLPLPVLAPGDSTYQVALIWADGMPTVKEGPLSLIDPDELPLLPYGQPVWKDAVNYNTIDLFLDGNHDRLPGYGGQADLSGSIGVHWDEQSLYVTGTVVDDVHSQDETGVSIWRGDSVQFALTAGLPGERASMHEFGMALTSEGPQLYRSISMNDKPVGPMEQGFDLRIERDEAEKLTYYYLELPWTELGPVMTDDGWLSFSVLVNDNDGAGRRGWIEWGAGIGATKNPALFNGMILGAAPVNDQP